MIQVDRNKLDYDIVLTEKELDLAISCINKLDPTDPLQAPCLDIETRPGHPKREANDRFTCSLAGIALSWAENQAAYIPLDHSDGNNIRYDRIVDSNVAETLRKLKPVAASFPWCNHMARFDWGVLRQPRHGLEVNYQFCSYLECYVTGRFVEAFKGQSRSDASLGVVVQRLYGHEMKGLEDIGGKSAPTEFFPKGRIDAGLPSAEDGAWYACDDACYARSLHRTMYPLVRNSFIYSQIEQPLMYWVEIMETNGIPFNSRICEEQIENLDKFKPKSLEYVFMQAERQLGFRPKVNLNSPAQVSDFFYSQPPQGLGFPAPPVRRKKKKFTKTGRPAKESKPSVGAKALVQLVKTFDLPFNYQTYKKLTKADDFLGDEKGLPKYVHPSTGRIHATFHQGGVPTGRFACGRPNLQNLADHKEYKLKDGATEETLILNVRNSMEVAEDELLYFHDNRQAELWVALEEAGQFDVLELIGQGWDGHQVTGSFLFNVPVADVTKDQRKSAKTRNFAIIYGESPAGMAEKLAVDIEEAEEFMCEYFRRFDKLHTHRTNFIEMAKQNMYIHTHYGRYVDLSPYFTHSEQSVRAHGERFAYNGLCQGTAGDIAKLQMLLVCRKLQSLFYPNPVPIIHQGHDALGYQLTPANFNFKLLPQFHQLVKTTTEFPVPGYRLGVRTDCKVGWHYGTLVDYNGEPYEVILEKIREKEAESKDNPETKETKQENLLLLPERTLLHDDIIALKALLQRNPGVNLLHLPFLDEKGETIIHPVKSSPTSLGLKDAAKFQMILPCKLVPNKVQEALHDIVRSAMN